MYSEAMQVEILQGSGLDYLYRLWTNTCIDTQHKNINKYIFIDSTSVFNLTINECRKDICQTGNNLDSKSCSSNSLTNTVTNFLSKIYRLPPCLMTSLCQHFSCSGFTAFGFCNKATIV